MIRRALLSLLLFCLLPTLPAGAGGKLEPAYDLQQLYRHEDDNRVLLLLVSQPGCHYCEQVRQEILLPMLASGNYAQTTLIRELTIHAGQSLKDFSGQKVNATQFARRYGAWATPTLLFLNRQGDEVADKMVGLNTPEFYGYYVDKSLAAAQAAVAP